MRRSVWSIVLLMIALSSCGGKSGTERVSLRIEGVDAETSPWHLYTYGTNEITIDTLELSSSRSVKWSKPIDLDTIDLFLVEDKHGLLQLPLLPNREGDITASLTRKGLELEGVIEADSIESWHKAKAEGLEGLMRFFENYRNHSLSVVLMADALRREPEAESKLGIVLATLCNQYPEIANILGIQMIAQTMGYGASQGVPYYFTVSGMKDTKPFKDVVGKRANMVINIMELTPDDSIAYQQQKHYFQQLDSLSLPSYSVLLNDALPSGMAKKDRYFLIDSIGESVEYLTYQNIKEIPTYILVDSIRQVLGSWHEADSLIKYVKGRK